LLNLACNVVARDLSLIYRLERLYEPCNIWAIAQAFLYLGGIKQRLSIEVTQIY
jgi:hypothetical protein